MKIAVLKETEPGEKRVAASLETVRKYVDLGVDVFVEFGAGVSARVSNTDYLSVGAQIVEDRAELLRDADVILSVRGPSKEDAAHISKQSLILGLFNPHLEKDRLEPLVKTGARLVSLEFIPRITRAQSMDVLSSQSNLAGYKAVLDALEHYGRAMPMMMTAAGTIAPAKVMIMGAGVAGLQAIATAKRMGAIVSATDVRLAAKEQVESLGGKFIMVEDEESEAAETSGGYAREMSEDYKVKQAALIAATLPSQDIVITTALIPGRKAPILLTSSMVETMKPGSVIVDLAAGQGGNVEGVRPDEVIEYHGVTLIGHTNTASRLAEDTSKLFARNLFNYTTPFIHDGALVLDVEDEILAQSTIAVDGALTHPSLTGEA